MTISFESKLKDLSEQCHRWLGNYSNDFLGQYYQTGDHLSHVNEFHRLFNFHSRMFRKYHFNISVDDIAKCYRYFLYVRAAKPKLSLATILYEKGFDRTDLLMLADEVTDDGLAEELRSTHSCQRGFWALDVLRVS